MTLVWKPGYSFDSDASTYIDAVETADGQALETGVRVAINDFVLGCKQDEIWDAIKASCILAGARTTNGALVPLVGTAPTPNNFDLVGDTDYDRKTGLVGDGSTKYLDSNRNNNLADQNDNSLGVFVNTAETSVGGYAGIGTGAITGSNHIGSDNNNGYLFFRSMSTAAQLPSGAAAATGFIGISRSLSSSFTYRFSGQSNPGNDVSQTPATGNIYIFARNVSDAINVPTNGRLQFYFIGESLDLAALDTRVSNLITAIGAAIP